MSRVFIGLVLVMFAASTGCNCGGGGASTAEGAAKGMLNAIKAKDIEATMGYMDLQGMYDEQAKQLKEAGMEVPKFEDWKKQIIEGAKAAAKEDSKKFDYRNLEVKEEGDTATVTVEIKEGDQDWKKQTVKLKKVNGKWMMPFEEMESLQ